MNEEYRVPKRCVPAELHLPGHSVLQVQLYLGDRARGHAGPERPRDVLNGPKTFIPVGSPEGGMFLVRRTAVLCLSVDAGHETETPEERRPGKAHEPEGAGGGLTRPPDLQERHVEVELEGGHRISGRVSYVLPAGERRLQDYLNGGDDFIPVRDEERIRLVNIHRIVRVRETEGGNPEADPRP